MTVTFIIPCYLSLYFLNFVFFSYSRWAKQRFTCINTSVSEPSVFVCLSILFCCEHFLGHYNYYYYYLFTFFCNFVSRELNWRNWQIYGARAFWMQSKGIFQLWQPYIRITLSLWNKWTSIHTLWCSIRMTTRTSFFM